MTKKIPLLDWDAPAEEVLEDFPMLRGATKSELSLIKSTTEDDMTEEDVALIRAIDILFDRMEDSDYIPADDDDDIGGAKVRSKVPV